MDGAIQIRVPNLVEDDYDRRGDTDEINVFGWLGFVDTEMATILHDNLADAEESVAMQTSGRVMLLIWTC